MLSFLNLLKPFHTVPSGRTTSKPSTDPCRLPYLSNRRPPAFVATTPPTWHDPFAPRSSGKMKPRSARYPSADSNTSPASATRMPLTGSNDCTEFMLAIEMISSSWIGFEPPARQLPFLYTSPAGLSSRTNEPGVPALGHNGNVILVAVLHDLRDLLRAFRLDHHLTLSVVLVQPVIVVRRQILAVGRSV